MENVEISGDCAVLDDECDTMRPLPREQAISAVRCSLPTPAVVRPPAINTLPEPFDCWPV